MTENATSRTGLKPIVSTPIERKFKGCEKCPKFGNELDLNPLERSRFIVSFTLSSQYLNPKEYSQNTVYPPICGQNPGLLLRVIFKFQTSKIVQNNPVNKKNPVNNPENKKKNRKKKENLNKYYETYIMNFLMYPIY